MAVSVTEAPTQTDELEALIAMEGAALTVIVFDTESEQPLLPVPVTEYVAVAAGLTVMLAEVAPLLHKYVEPPLAERVTDAPAHIVDADALMLMEGAALTVMVLETDAEQPALFVPVTV